MVDLEDRDLGALNWSSIKTDHGFYAARRVGPGSAGLVLLHRLIAARIGLRIDSLEVDHRDGDPLNNRRLNLRPATSAQNSQNQRLKSSNRSGQKGVSWDASRGQWFAKITVNRRQIPLGRFADLSQAAEAYSKAAALHFGEFVRR